MTRSMILAALAASMLSGCGIAYQMEMTRAKERMEVAKATCKTQFPDHYSERADCVTAAENAILGPLVTNEGDLLALYQAQRKITAMKLDQREITLEEARLEDAAALVATKQQAIDRNNAASMVSAAQYQPGPILIPVPVRHRH